MLLAIADVAIQSTQAEARFWQIPLSKLGWSA